MSEQNQNHPDYWKDACQLRGHLASQDVFLMPPPTNKKTSEAKQLEQNCANLFTLMAQDGLFSNCQRCGLRGIALTKCSHCGDYLPEPTH